MIDKDTIRRWWDIFVGDKGLVEVRILGKFQYSGYFKSVDNLINEIQPYSEMDNEQLYFTLNEINPDCYGRMQCEKFIKSPKTTTTDSDIIRRKTVMIDFDPVRATGVNASDDEFELAHKKAQEVFIYLRKEGFKEPVICRSGNGFHLQYAVDCENTDENTELIKRFLQSLSVMFSDEKVDIDEKVFNAGRICKLYGSMAKKGANIPERPWRMSAIIYKPTEWECNDIGLFKKIADLLPQEEPKALPNRNSHYNQQKPFELVSWLDEHAIRYRVKKSTDGSTIYELEECPWIEQHSDRKKWDSALFQDANGLITFNCTHSHCKGRTWHDFRLFYEPDAYDKPLFQPQQGNYPPQRRNPLVGQKKYEIKDVLPELGAKWLSLSDIKKVNLSEIGGVKTGFTELDRNIVQLNWGEVSLLSGSNSSGKSSWLNTLLLNVIQQGTPAALWSGELSKDIFKTWLQMVAAGKNHLRQSSYGDGSKYYVPNDVGAKIDHWLDGRFFLYNNEYGNTWEQIFNDMEELLKVGVRFFVLDNLFSLNIDLLGGDSKNDKQRELILQIKDFAKKKQVHIILVAHPRKTMAFLRKNDISGTSDLTNAVDNVFIIHRVNQDFFRAGGEFFGAGQIQRFQEFGNVIEVCKNRMYGVVDLLVGMHYEIESRRFKNTIDESIRYGWEAEPTQTDMYVASPQVSNVNTSYRQIPMQDDKGMPFAMPNDGEEAPF